MEGDMWIFFKLYFRHLLINKVNPLVLHTFLTYDFIVLYHRMLEHIVSTSATADPSRQVTMDTQGR